MEISNPTYTPPGLSFIMIYSAALHGRADMTVYMPAGHEQTPDLPMVTLLHGANASHWAWAYTMGAHVTLQRLIDAGDVPPMALIMPSDGLVALGSAYVAHADADYEAWILDDAPHEAMAAFPHALTDNSIRMVAGLSMGGFGALRLAAKYPDRFAASAAHSSVTMIDQIAMLTGEIVPSASAHPDDHALLYWLTLNKNRLPPFRFDCGIDDFLIAQNRTLHQALITHEIGHIYEEFDGAHNSAYWTAHIEDTLRFFGGILKEAAEKRKI